MKNVFVKGQKMKNVSVEDQKMKNVCFDQEEFNLVLKALRYTAECGYAHELCDEERNEYTELKALIDRLDPVPVKKEGWMIYGGLGNASFVYESKTAAEQWTQYWKQGRVVKITWEE